MIIPSYSGSLEVWENNHQRIRRFSMVPVSPFLFVVEFVRHQLRFEDVAVGHLSLACFLVRGCRCSGRLTEGRSKFGKKGGYVERHAKRRLSPLSGNITTIDAIHIVVDALLAVGILAFKNRTHS